MLYMGCMRRYCFEQIGVWKSESSCFELQVIVYGKVLFRNSGPAERIFKCGC